jgi:rhodanese-related sulfurtransferase
MATSPVSQIPAAAPAAAQAHFAHRLSLETDCADVHEAMTAAGGIAADFVLLERMDAWPTNTLLVVYCAGPHCNGGDRAALRLAELKRAVKLMLGGMTGWADEGFVFATGDAPGSAFDAAIPVTQAE